MAFPVTYRTLNRLRVTVSVLASAVIHAAVLLLMEYFGVFSPADAPADFEPLVVQIGSLGEIDLLKEEAEEPIPPPAEKPPEKPVPAQTTPPEPKPTVQESKPAPKPPAKPAERVVEPKQAVSPWSTLAQDADPELAGDPYGDIPTRETGGLRISGEDSVDTSLPAETVQPKATVHSFFEESDRVVEEAEPVTAESRPVYAASDAEGAIEGELLDALDSRLAETGTQPSRPQAAVVPAAIDDREGEDSLVEWQDKGKGRKLLSSVQPDLSKITNLDTPVLHIYAEIEVQAEGKVSKVSILESSGVTQVDAAVRAALSLWQFERVESGEGSVRGRIRYTITAVPSQS